MHWVCPLMLSPLLETLSHGISFVKNDDTTGQILNESERDTCQVIAEIEDLPKNSHFNFESVFFGKSCTRKGKITVPNQRRPDQYKKYVEHIAVQFYRSLYLREVLLQAVHLQYFQTSKPQSIEAVSEMRY